MGFSQKEILEASLEKKRIISDSKDKNLKTFFDDYFLGKPPIHSEISLAPNSIECCLNKPLDSFDSEFQEEYLGVMLGYIPLIKSLKEGESQIYFNPDSSIPFFSYRARKVPNDSKRTYLSMDILAPLEISKDKRIDLLLTVYSCLLEIREKNKKPSNIIYLDAARKQRIPQKYKNSSIPLAHHIKFDHKKVA